MYNQMITIITGSRGVGKTTFLLKQIAKLKKQGHYPSGVMTPAMYDNDGRKVGFFALDISSSEQWELGRSDKLLCGPSYGPYSFSEMGFARANKILNQVLREGSEDVFLDEIGPLELEKNYGFISVLSLISGFNLKRNLYLVIRSELIEKFTIRFIGENDFKIIRITQENRDAMGFHKNTS